MRLLFVSLLASGLALAQAPPIGLVELYGVRKVSEERIRSAIGVRVGDPLSVPKAAIEERMEKSGKSVPVSFFSSNLCIKIR